MPTFGAFFSLAAKYIYLRASFFDGLRLYALMLCFVLEFIKRLGVVDFRALRLQEELL